MKQKYTKVARGSLQRIVEDSGVQIDTIRSKLKVAKRLEGQLETELDPANHPVNEPAQVSSLLERYSELQPQLADMVTNLRAKLTGPERALLDSWFEPFEPAKPDFPETEIRVEKSRPVRTVASMFPLWAPASFVKGGYALIRGKVTAFFLLTIQFWQKAEAGGNTAPTVIFPPEAVGFIQWLETFYSTRGERSQYPEGYSWEWLSAEVRRMKTHNLSLPFTVYFELWREKGFDPQDGLEEVKNLFEADLGATEWKEACPDQATLKLPEAEIISPRASPYRHPIIPLIERLFKMRFSDSARDQKRVELAVELGESFLATVKGKTLYSVQVYRELGQLLGSARYVCWILELHMCRSLYQLQEELEEHGERTDLKGGPDRRQLKQYAHMVQAGADQWKSTAGGFDLSELTSTIGSAFPVSRRLELGTRKLSKEEQKEYRLFMSAQACGEIYSCILALR